MIHVDVILLYIRDVIGFIGVAVICAGALRAVHQMIKFVIQKKFNENLIRLQLGESIILGLEFMVGADIIGSLVEPDYYNLGLLAIIVVIRSVLSYFLSMELAALSPAQLDMNKGRHL